MSDVTDRIRTAELRQLLRPTHLRFLAQVGSTNQYTERLLQTRRIRSPAIVLAARQTAGRGRGGATWWSARGCLTMTVVLPGRSQIPPHELSIRAAVAIAEAIELPEVKLKWPNDLVALDSASRGKKLGGILSQRVSAGDLVGVGLNVNVLPTAIPSPLRSGVTSLRAIHGSAVDLTRLAARIGRQLVSSLRGHRLPPFVRIIEEYRQRDALCGRTIRLQLDESRFVEAVATGIDEQGRLILNSANKLRAVSAGHVARW